MSQQVFPSISASGKLDGLCSEGGNIGQNADSQNVDISDAELVYVANKSISDDSEDVVYQNTHIVGGSDSLFYTPVTVGDTVTLNAMLDSGSMACTMSRVAEAKLREAGLAAAHNQFSSNVVLVGCGGRRVKPESAFNVEIEVYGCRIIVPTLVVEGQHDELILGTNVIKCILRQYKQCDGYWKAVSAPCPTADSESVQFLSMLAGLDRWRGDVIPDKIGTVRCNSAVCLEPGREYLMWGKLPKSSVISPGSAVMTEPTTCRSAPRGVLVARVVTPLWGDRWVPLKLINTSDRPVLVRRNAKLADVFPCIALEDMDDTVPAEVPLLSCSQETSNTGSADCTADEKLKSFGLSGLDIHSCDVSEQCRSKMADLIVRYEDIFSRHHLDCGEAKGFVHRIHLSDQRPFRLPFRRVPPSQYQTLRQVLSEMEEKDIIRKSTSEYASPLVLVWKKNGDLRICTDFRWLNKRTLKDAHPLPHQADCLAALGGNTLFSTMDLTSGFYNMPLHEDDKKYSAFTTPMGLYEYNRLPQGLCNSPGSFMRMMTSIFGDQNYLSLLVYLDDLLVYAPDENTALERLEMVFSRLRGHNLKLAPKKCFFLRKSVRFLGHIVDETGVLTDPSKVESITMMTSADLMEADGVTPSQKRIRSFLGVINYYQHFVPNFSAIAKPLFSLLMGQKMKVKGNKLNKRPQGRRMTPADWTPEMEHAFQRLKAAVIEATVLAHPDFSRPFMLSTDASLDGIGAVLSQIQEGETKARPIAFASKSLSQSQRNYPAHRLEFLALKWSICDKFSHWLKGHKFTVWTDNNPLTHIMTKPKLDCCEQRWVAKLASYNFDIKYVPGPQNVVADALSRVPFVKDRVSHRLLHEPYKNLLSEVQDVSGGSVQDAFRCSNDSSTLCQVDVCAQGAILPVNVHIQSVEMDDVSAVLESYDDLWEVGARTRAVAALPHLPQLVSAGQDSLPAYTVKQLRDEQLKDPALSRVLYYVERRRRPSRRERAKESVTVLRYLKHWERFVVSDGILYRVSRDPVVKSKRHQYVVPDSLKADALKGVHDLAGHQGQFRSLSLTRQRFFWLHLDRDVRDYVRNCQRCIVSKTAEPAARAPLESITSTRPLQLVCIDFWTAEDSHNRSVDVLVITDHFTRMAQAFPCKDQSAKQVARVLWDKYFCVFGFPERIHSDQGASFDSQLVSELLRVSGVKKSHTTPYHPMGNGSVERFNRTLGNMIRALAPEAKIDWPRRLQTLTFMYNSTTHETTGYAPFYLMFGRTPRLPVDVLFRTVLSDPAVVSYDKYVASLAKDLKDAMVIAQDHATREQQRHAELYNRRVKGPDIDVGDRVLLANKRERGKRKVADRWESTVYTVVARNPETHTFKVCDAVTGRVKVVHRNLLMLVNFLPVDDVRVTSDSASLLSAVPTSNEPSDTLMSEVEQGPFPDGGSTGTESETGGEGSCLGSEGAEDRDMECDGRAAPLERRRVTCLSVPESVDSEGRTTEWVAQLPPHERSQVKADTVPPVSFISQRVPEHATVERIENQSDDSDSGPVTRTDGGADVSDNASQASFIMTVMCNASDTQCTDTLASFTHTEHSSAVTRVTSRFGRRVKPVNRLIYTMSRQAISQSQ